MIIRRYKADFAVLFLAYFMLCAVLPLSAAAPHMESGGISGQEVNRINPLVVDVVLWQILKRGKLSGEAGEAEFFAVRKGSKNLSGKAPCGAIRCIDPLPPPSPEAAHQRPAGRLKFTTHTPFVHSGLSPPSA